MQERTSHFSTKLTTPPLGTDRFRRLYWLLPRCGGVLVEGVKTSEGGSNAGSGEGGSGGGNVVNMKSENCEVKVKEENKIIEKCKLEEITEHSSDTNEGKFFIETKPVKENSENFQSPDSSPEKLSKTTEKLKEEKTETINNTTSPQKPNKPDHKNISKEAEDARNSYITNLEDIITRTVMDSMNEEEDVWNSPSFNKQNQILSDFLVDPTSSEIKPTHNKIEEIELTKKMKKLNFSLDRGMWFSVFNSRSPCTSISDNSLLHLPFTSFEHIKVNKK